MKHFTTNHIKKWTRSVMLFAICYLVPHFASSQTGSISSPYTELGMARNVPSAGTYYFNLTGTTFGTYVDANGWVQVAIDFGTNIGSLPQGTSLTIDSRGILNPTALSTLTSANEARLSSSTGNLNVVTTNATILSRITQNYVLSRGAVDNAINGGWAGTNVYNTQFLGTGCTQANTALNAVIFHPCGNASGFHWVQISNMRTEEFANIEIPSNHYFQLSVRASYVPVSTLPVELTSFSATCTGDNSVEIFWNTASEYNSDYFLLEKSTDTKTWDTVKITKAAGNSNSLLQYSYKDVYRENAYYRLSQFDFDGAPKTYSIISIDCQEKTQTSSMQLYPNPNEGKFNLSFVNNNATTEATINIYDMAGILLYSEDVSVKNGNNVFPIESEYLQNGIYLVRLQGSTENFSIKMKVIR